MKYLLSAPLVLSLLCPPAVADERPPKGGADINRSYAEYELATERAKNDDVRRELAAERDTLARLWGEQVRKAVRARLDAKRFAEARLLVVDALREAKEHTPLAPFTSELPALLDEAVRAELVLMDTDGAAGRLFDAIERGRALRRVRPDDAAVRAKLAGWEAKAREKAHTVEAQAEKLQLAGAVLFARRMAAAAGEAAQQRLDESTEKVRALASRRLRYDFTGVACPTARAVSLPTTTGVPLDVEIAVAHCTLDERRSEEMEAYTYEDRVAYTYDTPAGQDCSKSSERHFTRDTISGKSGWATETTTTCKERTTQATGWKTVTRQGKRLVKHIVTGLDLSGTVRVAETGESLPFAVRDEYDDRQYDAPGGKRDHALDGTRRMIARAGEVLLPLLNGIVAAQNAKKAAAELARAQAADPATAPLVAEDALVLAAMAGSGVPAALVAPVARRHDLHPDKALILLTSGGYVPDCLPNVPEPIAVIPKAAWTKEKDTQTNDRAIDRFIHARVSGLYGRPDSGDELGRFGLTIGGRLLAPNRNPVGFSMLVDYRIGLDHGLRFLYDLRAGLGLSARAGRFLLAAYGVGGVDRISMGDNYNLPWAFTYGGESTLRVELTRMTSLTLSGVWQKRSRGPAGTTTEKRLELGVLTLDKKHSGTYFGVAVEDHGVGRVFSVVFGD